MASGAVEQAMIVILRQYVGQEGREFGRVDEGRRVGGQLTPFDAPRKETAQGRNAPRERAGRVAAFAQPSDEQRDVFVVEAAEGRSSSSRKSRSASRSCL